MESAIVVLLTVLLVTAMCTDLRSSRIPNWLTFPTMGFALVAHVWMDGLQGAIFSLLGLWAGLGLFLILYISGSIGAGDVKLMAAVGAILGPYGALLSGLLAMMVGGLYALGAMCYHWSKAGHCRARSPSDGGQGLDARIGPPVPSTLWARGCGRYPTFSTRIPSLWGIGIRRDSARLTPTGLRQMTRQSDMRQFAKIEEERKQ